MLLGVARSTKFHLCSSTKEKRDAIYGKIMKPQQQQHKRVLIIIVYSEYIYSNIIVSTLNEGVGAPASP